MKNVLFFIMVLPCTLYAQVDFQKIDRYGIGSSATFAVAAKNDTFITGTFCYDIDSTLGLKLIKFDSAGNELKQLGIFDSIHWLTRYDNYAGLEITPDNQVAFWGSKYVFPAKTNYLVLTDMNLDSFRMVEYENTDPAIEFQGNTDLIAYDGGYYLAGVEQVKSDLTTNGMLMKVDRQGNLLWRRSFGKPGKYERAYSLTMRSDNEIVLAGMRNWSEGTGTEERFFSRAWMIGVDSSGNLLWEWIRPTDEVENSAQVHSVLAKGDILYYSSALRWFDYSHPFVPRSKNRAFIGALDADRNTLWETPVPIPFTFNAPDKCTFSADSMNIIAIGQNEDYFRFFHFKVKLDGTMEFFRKDEVFCLPDSQMILQAYALYDIAVLPSNSTISCGDILLYTDSLGWLYHSLLLKTNGTGTPDSGYCGWAGTIFPTSSAQAAAPKPQLLMYPNPTTDLLHIELPPDNGLDIARIRIFSASGRLIEEREIIGQQTVEFFTFGWPIGLYSVQFVARGGEVVTVGKGIKM